MASSPTELTLIRGRSGAWPIQAYTIAGTAATGLYAGTEALTAQVFYGADAPLPIAPTVAWIDGPSGQYIISFTAAQSAAVAVGTYTLAVAVDPSGTDGPLLEIPLVVEPAPTDGTGALRTLAMPGEYIAIAPDDAANPAVAAALESATRAVEAYCRRPFVLSDYDHTERPGRVRKIYLKAWPVQGEAILTCDVATAGGVRNTDGTTNQQASVTLIPASAGSLAAKSLTLTRTASGIVSTDAFTLSDYATIGALQDAISAIGNGWQVISPGYASTANYQNVPLLPTSRLVCTPGRFGALHQQVELHCYATEVAWYLLDDRRGVIELGENRPEAFRYPDRAFAQGWGWAGTGASRPLHANVRCQYRAGYAIAQADLMLGHDPVPQDLKMATILTAKAILSAPAPIGAVHSQSLSGQKLTLRADASIIPKAARGLLRNYMNDRIGGWGQ